GLPSICVKLTGTFSFRDSFRAHTEHMQHFTRSFSEPFDASVMPSLTDGTSQGGRMAQSNSPHALTQNQRVSVTSGFLLFVQDLMRNPIGIVNNMITNMRNRVDMPRDFVSENGHSFSSSSVMTYSKVGNEPPKVFQASSSTLRAPGGIKETRQAIKDSESGLQKMAIGHHIQDRGHIMEKKFNNKTGEKEFNQDFQNLDESEAEAFDEEFKQKVSTVKSDGHRSVSITFNQEQGHRSVILSLL
uniref:Myeloid leukemia factor 1 n=1 Tax=Periophthalmus magnuspinnatus TaxID=409849 RepID=A0A3B4A4X0_9GOBI